ncbi:hypothetical protein J4Q44_G00092730 [Coregonus suidteri]|uniref:Uncharacterized protein n=1 Tax=Coregonus suidteri TaxID=861788 RepID=A0AAN8R0Z6_9TELE
MAEADDEVESESNGGRIMENLSIVQKNGKRSKVAYSDENDPSYLVGVRFVNEEQLSRVPILKKPFELSKLVERVLGKVKNVRITRGGLV